MEKQWFKLLDKLDSIGLPVYTIITPLEDAGVPTLWLTLGITLILLSGLTVSIIPEKTVTFNITITRNEKPLKNAIITINDQTQKTSSTGQITLKIPYGTQTLITITHPDCEKKTINLPAKDDYTANISLKCTT